MTDASDKLDATGDDSFDTSKDQVEDKDLPQDDCRTGVDRRTVMTAVPAVIVGSLHIVISKNRRMGQNRHIGCEHRIDGGGE